MNERHEQLMAQAWIEFAPDAKAVTKRFAELIVQECVDVIKQNEGSSLTVSNFTDEKIQGIQLGLGFAICDIKEHFGVEE